MADQYKTVTQRMPEPFEQIEIDVTPVSTFGKPGIVGHSVGVMNLHIGRGNRTGIERAEAEAKAVLRAIRSYRRRNAKLLAEEADRG